MKLYKTYAAMVFATLLFAGAFVAGKIGTAEFSPIVMTFLRIGLATLIIFPIMIIKEKNTWKPNKRELILSIQLGLIGMTFYHLFFFSALRYTSVTNASVINATMPIITAILAFVFIKEKISWSKSLYILIAFCGVILTITNWNLKILFELNFNRGDLLMICGTISWSSYGILVRKGIKTTSALKMTAYTLLMCVVMVSPFALKEIVFDHALSGAGKNYYTIIYMALFPTVIGYTIQQRSIKILGPSTAALFINLVPIFSIILSVLILGDTIAPLTFVSGGMIIYSVYKFAKIS